MIWLAAILVSVLASVDVACIMIAEKAHLRKSEIFESILKEHPDFKSHDLRRKITQDVFYYCTKIIDPQEADYLKFDRFNSFKRYESLMHVNPSNYQTKEDLVLSPFFKTKYQALIKERNKVIRKLKKLPDLPEEEESKNEEKVEKKEIEEKKSKKKPGNQRIKEFQANAKVANRKPKEEFSKSNKEKTKIIQESPKVEIELKKTNEQVESEEIPKNSETNTKEDL